MSVGILEASNKPLENCVSGTSRMDGDPVWILTMICFATENLVLRLFGAFSELIEGLKARSTPDILL
jgi:hypothetical protein